MRERIRRVFAAFAATVVVAGCSRLGMRANGTGNPWTHHGVLVYAEAQNAKTLNPVLSADLATGDLSMLLFSYTVVYDQYAQPHPEALREIPTIANGDVSPDGLTLKYKLRNDILFHDGVRLTCRDLAFTWHVVMNPANNDVTQDGYRDIRSIDCSDPFVAVIHMKRIYAPFLQELWGVNGNAPILPEHLLAKYNDAKGSFNTAPFNAAPIGSGPFRFVRWDRGSQVVLRAFPRYFLGRPKLDGIVYKYVPDMNTLATEIRTHEIDMALHAGGDIWPLLQNVPGTVLTAPSIYTYDHVDFNLHDPLFSSDVDLRRALELGLDRQSLLDKVAHGLGDLSETALSPKLSWAWTDSTPHYDYDVGKARALLDADGWATGADGIRVKHGQRLSFDLSAPTESSSSIAYEVVIQNQWHDLGADVRVKNVPSAEFFDNSPTATLQGGRYDVAIFSWTGSSDPDDSPLYAGWNLAPRGQNAIYWDDPVANAAMEDEVSTLDRDRRLRDFHVEEQRFADQVPSIVLLYRREPLIYNSDLRGFSESPVISPFWDPQEYSI